MELHEKYPAMGLDSLYRLLKPEFGCSRKRVHWQMKLAGISSCRRRACKVTTNSNHSQAAKIFIPGPTSNDFIRVDCRIIVRCECEHLRHIDPVVALKAIPPIHSISLPLAPGGQPHERQIGKAASPIHGYQADPHLFIPFLPKRAGLLSVLWTSSKPALFILCILRIQIPPDILNLFRCSHDVGYVSTLLYKNTFDICNFFCSKVQRPF